MPISLRLPDDVIEVLKKEARKISFEQDKDVSYVDLVRDAVKQYVSGVTPPDKTLNPIEIHMDYKSLDKLPNLVKDSLHKHLIKEDHLSSPFSQFRTMNQVEWMKLWGIDLENPLALEIASEIVKVVEGDSLARRLLLKDELFGKPVSSYSRDITSVVYYISRRGAVPESFSEGDTFIPPTFEIAAMPSIRILEMLSQRIELLKRSVQHGAEALLREEEANAFNLFSQASEGVNTIEVGEDFKISHLEEAFGRAIINGFTPANIVIHNEAYFKLANEAANKKGNWNFKIAGNLKMDAGHFMTATLRVADGAAVDTILFLAPPGELGTFVERSAPRVLIYPEPSKLRVAFVLWVDIGMFASNTKVVRLLKSRKPLGEPTTRASSDLTDAHVVTQVVPPRGTTASPNPQKVVRRRS